MTTIADTTPLETILRGTRGGGFFRELFTNSIHFPLANIFLEMLLSGPLGYLEEPDPYVILGACLVQAWFLSGRAFIGRPAPFVGNLLGPLLYTLVEWPLEGTSGFWQAPNHVVYWVFALLVGGFQSGGLHLPRPWGSLSVLLENLVRTNILLVTYALFDALEQARGLNLSFFLEDKTHIFILLVLLFLGLVVGFANILAQRYLETLQRVSQQLRRYSEWLLGPRLLAGAMAETGQLELTRRDRTILFMDIRGFTAWSEQRGPEEVVAMLNAYFALGAQALAGIDTIKVKHTADEIMVVLPTPRDGVIAARSLAARIWPRLHDLGLLAGGGLHRGEVVEGLIGSDAVKAYDVIGDTVNTAKRLCDNAPGGVILVSEAVAGELPAAVASGEAMPIHAKGKSQPLMVRPLLLV
ncbi:MAG: adenylate/guanylate cyclase domain-containing protein [Magnetococcales bacterium]|nr:adenylate/guanylate cyclase domain-containing protein [Magnetococcales bacterium]